MDAQDVDREGSGLLDGGVGLNVAGDADEDQRWLDRDAHDGADRHAEALVPPSGGHHRYAAGDPGQVLLPEPVQTEAEA